MLIADESNFDCQLLRVGVKHCSVRVSIASYGRTVMIALVDCRTRQDQQALMHIWLFCSRVIDRLVTCAPQTKTC